MSIAFYYPLCFEIMMVERKIQGDTGKKQSLAKVELGYKTGVQLVGLVSQEIYGRFSAMLTANSIIFGIIGLVYTNNVIENKSFLLICLFIIGLFFCVIWNLFNRHGLYYQKKFRDEVKRLEEKYYCDTFRLMAEVKTEGYDEVKSSDSNEKKIYSYERLSNFLILLFFFIYSAIIIFNLIPIILTFFGL